MTWFDSHCHLHDDRVTDAAAQLARARAAGVGGVLLAGVESRGWVVEAALSRAHPDVFASYGIHPQWVAGADDAACDAELAALARALSDGIDGVRAVALGEIGLDGLGDRRDSLDRQERVFRAQLALARAHDLPVALHVLRAHPRALAVLADAGLPRAGAVLHSCSASAELVREYLALGCDISFAGAITYETAKKAPAAARAVPLDRLLVETDAPDQVPTAHKPGPNQPAYLPTVIAALAALRGESIDVVGAATAANARRLLRLV